MCDQNELYIKLIKKKKTNLIVIPKDISSVCKI